MNKIKISVIIPCYNSAKFLPECLDSIMKQTFHDIEIICVNDGSTDETLNILNNYKDKDERFKIFTIEHSGAACARNFGITKSRGEFLSILDSDDIFKADMLEKMYNKATSVNADITVCNSAELDNRTKKITQKTDRLKKIFLPEKEVFSRLDFKNNFFDTFIGWSWDKLFKKDLILQNNLKFQNIRSSNDLSFVFTALALAKRITTVDDSLILYRCNTNTQLSQTRNKDPLCFIEAVKKFKQELEDRGIYIEMERDFVNWMAGFVFWHLESTKSLKNKLIIKKILKKNLPLIVDLHLSEPDYYYNNKSYKNLFKLIKKKSLLDNILIYKITEELK